MGDIPSSLSRFLARKRKGLAGRVALARSFMEAGSGYGSNLGLFNVTMSIPDFGDTGAK